MNTLFAAKSVARMATMPSFSRGFATGTAKWFNMTKGFGFITPDDGNQPDVFVHQSSIASNGFRYLKEGERVQYDIQQTEKGIQAINVRDENGNAFVRPERQPFGGERRPRVDRRRENSSE